MLGRHLVALLKLLSLLTVCAYSITWDTQYFHELPVQSCFIILCVAGLSVCLAGIPIVRNASYHASKQDGGNESRLVDREDTLYPRSSVPAGRSSRLNTRQRRFLSCTFAAVLLARIWLVDRIRSPHGCANPGIEPSLLPILLAVHDYFTRQKSFVPVDDNHRDISNSIFDDLSDSCFQHTSRRYLLPTALLGAGVLLSSADAYGTTYVCPEYASMSTTFIYQAIATGLDAFLVIVATRLLQSHEHLPARVYSTGHLLLGSTLFAWALSTVGQKVLLQKTLRGGFAVMTGPYLLSCLYAGLSLGLLILTPLIALEDCQPLLLTNGIVFMVTFIPQNLSAWQHWDAFTQQSTALSCVGFICLCLGFMGVMVVYGSSENSNDKRARMPSIAYVFIFGSCFVVGLRFLSRSSSVGFHPIDLLMYDADVAGEGWLEQASSSRSLLAAVEEYARRYDRSPPPHFDEWFRFAKDHDSVIYDDFDSIERDIIPYWGVEPSAIRQIQTEQTLGGAVVHITIRKGLAQRHLPEATTNFGYPATTTIIDIINQFAKWLPDMDLVLNTRDHPVQALRTEVLSSLRKLGQTSSRRNLEKVGRVDLMKNNQLEPLMTATGTAPQSSAVTAWRKSSRSVYDTFVSSACTPSTAARNERTWNNHKFCTHCIRPHSLGQFMLNWTLAADLCHQPDMAELHSFLSSPAYTIPDNIARPFLLPVFSFHKIPGFNDILMPHPDQFYDHAVRQSIELDFKSKRSRLAWYDSFREGSSSRGSWRGEQPQRLSHMGAVSSGRFTVLYPQSHGRLSYNTISNVDLREVLPIEVGIPHSNVCAKGKCVAQAETVPSIDNAVLNRTTLLDSRYIIDLDGGSTEGNGLSLVDNLHAMSVTFAASIYRTWFSDRLTPWKHFVPIDSRFHAVHSTLAYFMGLNGSIGGKHVTVEGHEEAAASIALQGRNWVEKAVRRADAEIYMFRLLLEWGRVLDDNREELGLVLTDEHDDNKAENGA